MRDVSKWKDWIVNESSYDCLKLVDGKRTIGEISQALKEEYGGSNLPEIISDVSGILIKLIDHELCSISDKCDTCNVVIHDSDTMFPFEGLSLAVTTECNFKCKYCYVEPTTPAEMPFSDYCRIIDECVEDLGMLHLGLTGGEPLLVKDILRRVEYAAQKGCKVTILTNGWLLSKDRIQELKDVGLFRLGISFDSDDEHVFDSLTGVCGSYSRVLDNIRCACEMGYPVAVGIVIIKGINDSKESLHSVESKLHELGVNSISYTPVFPFGKAADLSEYVLEPEKLAELKEFTCYPDEGGITWLKRDNIALFEDELRESVSSRDIYREDMCNVGKGVLHILPDGRITPCPSLPDIDLGKFGDIRLKELWKNSEVLKSIRNFRPGVTSECRDCNILEFCKGGCRARAYYDKGYLNSRDRWACAMYKSYR